MSDKVVDLSTRRIVSNPHREGEARCLNCKHEWMAVAPAATINLECSQCGTFQGMFKGIAQTEFAQWRCECGELVFFIDERGPYCCHCGVRPSL